MKNLSGVLLVSLVLSGCKGDAQNANPNAIPSDAKFVEAKDPPITADTRYAAGQLLEAQNEPAKAIQQYQQATVADAKHAPSLYRLGVLYAQTEQYPQAVEVWQKYIKVTSPSATGWANLGFCYELMGSAEQAEAAYKKGIERDPRDQLCRINYGLMLARLGRINEALVSLQAVLTPAAAHYNLGSVYEQQGKKAQAKMEYIRSLELDPTFSDSQQRLAAITN